MHDFETAASLWLVHVGLGGSMLMLLALIGMRWVRQPARRQRLGELAVAASVVALVVSLFPAWLHLPWLGPQEAPVTNLEFAKIAPDPMVVWMEVEPVERGEERGARGEAIPRPSPLVPHPSPLTPRPSLVPWLVGVYALGAGFFLVRWLVGHFALHRILLGAGPVPQVVRRLFEQQFGGRRLPRLLMSRCLRVPVSCGIVRPTIILPAGLCNPADIARLPWVFAHEWTHLERGDAWSGQLFALGQALFFPLPWFWTLRRQVRLCQEYVADAAALRGSPADLYAEFLLSWAESPTVPVAATGVSGNKSDLFRRVTMLLDNPVHVENRCPRLWTLGLASGLLVLALILGGVGLAAQAQDPLPAIQTEPQNITKPLSLPVQGELPLAQEREKAQATPRNAADEAGKKKNPAQWGFELNLKPGKWVFSQPNLPDLENLQKLIQNMQQQPTKVDLDELRKLIDQIRVEVVPGTNVFRYGAGHKAASPATRLGLKLSKPSDILAEQLNLAKGQGLMVTDVKADSPGAKAGLKVNDLLLKVNNKAVPDDVAAFTKELEAFKPDTAVDLVVLRKGKEETVKGLKLPEKAAVPNPLRAGAGFGFDFKVPPPVLFPAAPGSTVMTTSFRTGDRFTTRYQEGSLIITVTGKVAAGKANPDQIHIHDGLASNQYDNVNGVPAQYRDKVNHLIRVSSGTEIQLEKK